MNITERAESAAKAAYAVLQVTPSEGQDRSVTDAIEQAIINAVLEESTRCTNVVLECCSPDLDTAHKVAQEIRRANQALIANLSSMR